MITHSLRWTESSFRCCCFFFSVFFSSFSVLFSVRATATVELENPEKVILVDAAIGNGPVDAVFKSINRIVGVSTGLTEYEVRAVTGGSDAVGEVTVRITEDPLNGTNSNGAHDDDHNHVEADVVTYHGHGADSDILTASAKAYVSAINKMLSLRAENGGTSARPSKKRKAEGI
jgi:2-isopropylmalate synthase